MKSRPPKPVMERLLSKVEIDPDTECWVYVGRDNGCGYAQVQVDRKRSHGTARGTAILKLVHRVAYEHLVGPIPEGLVIDHLCRVRKCVNPDHLEAVTYAENNRRALAVRKANQEAAA